MPIWSDEEDPPHYDNYPKPPYEAARVICQYYEAKQVNAKLARRVARVADRQERDHIRFMTQRYREPSPYRKYRGVDRIVFVHEWDDPLGIDIHAQHPFWYRHRYWDCAYRAMLFRAAVFVNNVELAEHVLEAFTTETLRELAEKSNIRTRRNRDHRLRYHESGVAEQEMFAIFLAQFMQNEAMRYKLMQSGTGYLAEISGHEYMSTVPPDIAHGSINRMMAGTLRSRIGDAGPMPTPSASPSCG